MGSSFTSVGLDNGSPLARGIAPIAAYPLPLADRQGPASHWQVDASQVVLLIHDMQNYFIGPFDRDESPGYTLLTGAKTLLEGFRNLGAPIIYTAQPGGMTSEERGLLYDFWGTGMSRDARDNGIIPELEPRRGEHVITKWRYSAFARTELKSMMRAVDRSQLVICGVFGHVGVLGTALDAYASDIKPFIVGDAIADFSPEYHELALSYASARCARVLSTEVLLKEVQRPVLSQP